MADAPQPPASETERQNQSEPTAASELRFQLDALTVAAALQLSRSLSERFAPCFEIVTGREPVADSTVSVSEAGEMLALALTAPGQVTLGRLMLSAAEISCAGETRAWTAAQAMRSRLLDGVVRPSFAGQLSRLLAATPADTAAVGSEITIRQSDNGAGAVLVLSFRNVPGLVAILTFGVMPPAAPVHELRMVSGGAISATGITADALANAQAEPGTSLHLVQEAMATARMADAVIH